MRREGDGDGVEGGEGRGGEKKEGGRRSERREGEIEHIATTDNKMNK